MMNSFMAWGSGRDYAMGAMEMGADARRAVEVTNVHSTDCGFGVEAYDLEMTFNKSLHDAGLSITV